MKKEYIRLPRKVKKVMKRKYQEVDKKLNIKGSVYDGFVWFRNIHTARAKGTEPKKVNTRYYGKIRNWRDLINCL